MLFQLLTILDDPHLGKFDPSLHTDQPLMEVRLQGMTTDLADFQDSNGAFTAWITWKIIVN